SGHPLPPPGPGHGQGSGAASRNVRWSWHSRGAGAVERTQGFAKRTSAGIMPRTIRHGHAEAAGRIVLVQTINIRQKRKGGVSVHPAFLRTSRNAPAFLQVSAGFG